MSQPGASSSSTHPERALLLLQPFSRHTQCWLGLGTDCLDQCRVSPPCAIPKNEAAGAHVLGACGPHDSTPHSQQWLLHSHSRGPVNGLHNRRKSTAEVVGRVGADLGRLFQDDSLCRTIQQAGQKFAQLQLQVLCEKRRRHLLRCGLEATLESPLKANLPMTRGTGLKEQGSHSSALSCSFPWT